MKIEKICKQCGKEMVRGHCYNITCANYDPISQYFDGPTEEELAADAVAIEERLNNLGTPSASDDMPF